MTSSVCLDSNVIVGYLDHEDALHERATFGKTIRAVLTHSDFAKSCDQAFQAALRLNGR